MIQVSHSEALWPRKTKGTHRRLLAFFAFLRTVLQRTSKLELLPILTYTQTFVSPSSSLDCSITHAPPSQTKPMMLAPTHNHAHHYSNVTLPTQPIFSMSCNPSQDQAITTTFPTLLWHNIITSTTIISRSQNARYWVTIWGKSGVSCTEQEYGKNTNFPVLTMPPVDYMEFS